MESRLKSSSKAKTRETQENIVPNYTVESIYGKNFFFQQRRGNLDLRSLSQIDIERIVRDVDIDVLQMYLENITFCNLREEDMRHMTDPLVVKLFRVAQLMIEYLLYVQEQLATNMNTLALKYSEKKRSLAAKRRELAELKEHSKVLKAQVRTRKQNVATLENMLLNAKSTKRRSAPRESVPPPKSSDTEAITRPAILKFYVTGPEGLCIEFNERGSTTIADVLVRVLDAFKSTARPSELSENGSRGKRRSPRVLSSKLIYQGRILLEDRTLDEEAVRPGDTVVAVVKYEEAEREEREPVVEKHAVITVPVQGPAMPDLNEFLGKQQETLRDVAIEMRRGWEAAMAGLAMANPKQRESKEIDLNLNIDEKWARLESSMKRQMDAQLEYYEKQLQELKGKPGHVVAGDLESDDDRPRRSTREIIEIRERDDGRVGQLEADLRSSYLLIGQLRAEMDMLRSQITAPKSILVTAPAPAPAPGFTKVLTESHSSSARLSKWATVVEDSPIPKDKGSAAGSVLAPVQTHVQVVETFSVAPPTKSVEPSPAPRKPAGKPTPAPVIIEATLEPVKPAQSSGVEGYTRIRFPSQHNTELAQWFANGPKDTITVPSLQPPRVVIDSNSTPGPLPKAGQVLVFNDRVDVWVLEALSLDDLVFDLRRLVAEKAKIPLARVELRLQGKLIRLGLDIDEKWAKLLNVSTANKFSEEGTLSVSIAQGNPITDAQIDVLVAEWEKKQLSTSDSGSLRQSSSLTDLWPLSKGQGSQSKKISPPQAQGAGIASQVSSVAGFERLGSMYMRGDRVLIGDNSSGGESDNKLSRSASTRNNGVGAHMRLRKSKSGSSGGPLARSWDDPSDEILNSKFEQVYSELDETLSALSESEGLTDDELRAKMSKLRKSTDALPSQITDHIRLYRERVVGAVSIAMDSDNAGEGTDDGRPVNMSASLRDSAGASPLANQMNSSARGVSGQLLRLSLPVNKRRSYDEGEDADSPLIGSTDRLQPTIRGTMSGTMTSNIPADPNSPMFSVSMSMFQSLDSAGKDRLAHLESSRASEVDSFADNQGRSNLGIDGNGRLHAIESPTVHSRRPSKESVVSETAHELEAIASASIIAGNGKPAKPAEKPLKPASREPSPGANLQGQGMGNASPIYGVSGLNNTGSSAGGAVSTATEDELSYSRSSSVSGRGQARGRYGDQDLRESVDEDMDDAGPWTKTASTLSTVGSLAADYKGNGNSAGSKEISSTNRRVEAGHHIQDDDYDSADDYKHGRSDYKGQMDSRQHPDTKLGRFQPSPVVDMVSSFDNSGFVSNVTVDDYGSTLGSDVGRQSASIGADFDSTFDDSVVSSIADTKDVDRRLQPRSNAIGDKGVSHSDEKASLRRSTDDEEDDVNDDVMEFTPEKSRITAEGLTPSSVNRSKGGVGTTNMSMVSKHSALTVSPFDHMKDKERDDDNHSLALSDSGVLDNDVMDFSQSLDSR